MKRKEEVERPEGLAAVYFRVYCPGKQVPRVSVNGVHLKRTDRHVGLPPVQGGRHMG